MPRDEVRELRAIGLYLCDRLRDVVAGGLHTSVVWPAEVLDPMLTTMILQTMWLFDTLSEGYTRENYYSARSQLEIDLSHLSKYFSAWNDSKRVAFDSGIPGRSVVQSVDAQKINEYVTTKLQKESTVFAGSYVGLYTGLYEHNQTKAKKLFSFNGRSFDSIKYRAEHKLQGQQGALAMFEVTHLVTVSERDKAKCYRVYASMASPPGFTLKKVFISAQDLAKRVGFTHDKAETAFPDAQHCEQLEALSLPPANYMCDVDMQVSHNADARIWVHGLVGGLTFGIVAAFNHSRTFKSKFDAKFQLSIPIEAIRPAFVWFAASNLMDLLMGDSVVRLQHEAKWVGVYPASKELCLVSRESVSEANDSPQTLFEVHPTKGGSFLLSTYPCTDTKAKWMRIRDGQLVAIFEDGQGESKFALHRLSTSYNEWVLQEINSKQYVAVGSDTMVLRLNPGGRTQFSFLRRLQSEID